MLIWPPHWCELWQEIASVSWHTHAVPFPPTLQTTPLFGNPFPASVFSTVALWHHCSLETKGDLSLEWDGTPIGQHAVLCVRHSWMNSAIQEKRWVACMSSSIILVLGLRPLPYWSCYDLNLCYPYLPIALLGPDSPLWGCTVATLAILFAQAGPHVVVQYRGATGPFNPYV